MIIQFQCICRSKSRIKCTSFVWDFNFGTERSWAWIILVWIVLVEPIQSRQRKRRSHRTFILRNIVLSFSIYGILWLISSWSRRRFFTSLSHIVLCSSLHCVCRGSTSRLFLRMVSPWTWERYIMIWTCLQVNLLELWPWFTKCEHWCVRLFGIEVRPLLIHTWRRCLTHFRPINSVAFSHWCCFFRFTIR